MFKSSKHVPRHKAEPLPRDAWPLHDEPGVPVEEVPVATEEDNREADAPAPRRSPLRSFASFLWTSTQFGFLLGSLLLVCAVIVAPMALGAVPLAILTNSMEPTMPPGTMAVVQPVDGKDIRIGMVITYQPEPGVPALVTHRVTEITEGTDGSRTLTLQGDNNGSPDEQHPSTYDKNRIKGQTIYAIPYMGHLTTKIHNGEGKKWVKYAAYAFIGYGALLFLAGAVSGMRKKFRKADPTNAADPAADALDETAPADAPRD